MPYKFDKNDKSFSKYSLLPIGGLLLPITLHSIHLMLPLLMAGSASLSSSHSHMGHQDPNMTLAVTPLAAAPWLQPAINLITVISAIFTLWYLIHLWTHKAGSRRWAWIYSGLSIVCFGAMLLLL
ncbi:hypothetical protein [Paenibacillus agricola]|uniref:Uncharacterized protein n=1 Tax=Paenibacillus agricola TaxID=2716264 RepID=A0ABX0J6W9_9BACL|nr:hypothetical protein [Paenibacillus agricola]NHN29535.1 hypothetical protein [Paenibacillus agricola]